MTKPKHAITVWTRDRVGTAWAWSCSCGRRYTADLATANEARAEAASHHRSETIARGAA